MKTVQTTFLLGLATALTIVGPAQAWQDDVERALAELAMQIDEVPNDAGALNDYGNLLVRASRTHEAREAYETAIRLSPDFTAAHYNLGLLQLERGKLRSARRHVRKTLKLDPEHARARYALGEIYNARGRNPRAVRHYARAFALDPSLQEIETNPEILFNRLASWASMKTYLDSSLNRRTREYDSPQDLVRILVPESTMNEETPEADDVGDADDENR